MLTINPLSIYPILVGLSRAQSATSGYTVVGEILTVNPSLRRGNPAGPHLLPEFTFTRCVHAVMQLDAPLLSRQRFRSLQMQSTGLSGRTHFSFLQSHQLWRPRSVAIFQAHWNFNEQLAIMPCAPLRIS